MDNHRHSEIEQLLLDEVSFDQLADNMFDALYVVDTNRVIRYLNLAAELLTGFSAKEVLGSRCSDNILCHMDSHGTNLCKTNCPLAATMRDGQVRQDQVFLHHKHGHRLGVLVRTTPIKNSHGEVIGGIEIFTDDSSHSAYQQRIQELEAVALLDNLTQLPNRNYLERELHSVIEEYRRFKVPFGVFFIDIDFFKLINDTHGHLIGDEVLKFISKTIAHNSRTFDVYGRWGGEEFIGIIRNTEFNELKILGERMRILIDNSYIKVGEETIHVSVTIGATMVKPDDNIESILKRADKLMYEGKSSGRNRLIGG